MYLELETLPSTEFCKLGEDIYRKTTFRTKRPFELEKKLRTLIATTLNKDDVMVVKCQEYYYIFKKFTVVQATSTEDTHNEPIDPTPDLAGEGTDTALPSVELGTEQAA